MRNRTRSVDAMRETAETWAESEIKRRQERAISEASNPNCPENSKEAGGEAQGTQGLSKN